MAFDLCGLGCVATTADILEREHGLHATVDLYQSSPDIVRIRNGLYACAHLDADVLAALRAGGQLDCISALELVGEIATRAGISLADTAPDCTSAAAPLHVRYRRGDHWAHDRIAASDRRIIAHWHGWRVEPPTGRRNWILTRNRRAPIPRGYVPPAEAFAQSLLCLVPEHSVKVIDALAASGVLTEVELSAIIAEAPRRTRVALRQAGRELRSAP